MFLRILIGAALVVGLMAAVRDGRVLRYAGVTGSCAAVAGTPDGGVVEACSPGRLEGRPDLSRQGCRTRGVDGKREYWDCPATVDSRPGA